MIHNEQGKEEKSLRIVICVPFKQYYMILYYDKPFGLMSEAKQEPH
jgi:hypothetical protein